MYFCRFFLAILCILLLSSGVNAQALWSHSYGDMTSILCYDLATDNYGNIIIAGGFVDTKNFGGLDLTSAGGYDVFVAKYNSYGDHLWSYHFGDSESQSAYNVACDGSGNIFVAGRLEGTINFGGSDLTNPDWADVFLVKFDGAGNHLWSYSFGDAHYDWQRAIAADASGNVIIAGTFYDTIDFGGGTLTSAGDEDIFVGKFDANGVHKWSKSFGAADHSEYVYGVGVDNSGNVVLGGHFADVLNFGGDPLVSTHFYDIFLAKLEYRHGDHMWSMSFPGDDSEYFEDLAIDDSENIIITGQFGGTANLGGDDLTSAGLVDIFLAKYSPSGSHYWSKRFGDTENDAGFGVGTDSYNNIILTGLFRGTVDFGGLSITSAGNQDIFLAKFKPGGTLEWSRGFGDASDFQSGKDVVTDGSNRIIVLGSFEGTVDFGGNPLTNQGASDIFLVKFAPGGIPVLTEWGFVILFLLLLSCAILLMKRRKECS